MEQIKEDYADRVDNLQYAEQLLEKAKADFRDKNSRIKALEAHLNESRNKISRLTRPAWLLQRGAWKFPEGNSSTLMNYAMSRQGQDVHRPHPCKQGRVTGFWTDTWVKDGGDGVETFTGALWRTLPHNKAKRICCSQPQIVAELGP